MALAKFFLPFRLFLLSSSLVAFTFVVKYSSDLVTSSSPHNLDFPAFCPIINKTPFAVYNNTIGHAVAICCFYWPVFCRNYSRMTLKQWSLLLSLVFSIISIGGTLRSISMISLWDITEELPLWWNLTWIIVISESKSYLKQLEHHFLLCRCRWAFHCSPFLLLVVHCELLCIFC